ncbi:MAG: hypothetical protein ABSG52_15735 [Terriglobales bacterium]|jgi:hypothetical protein
MFSATTAHHGPHACRECPDLDLSGLVAQDEGVTGKYFARCKVAKVSNAAQDDIAAERLWRESLRLARLQAQEESMV